MDIYKSPSFCLQVCSSSDHISSSTQTTDSSSPSLIQSEITPTIPAWLLCKDMDPPTQVPVMDLDKALGASASYPGQPPFIKKCLPLDHSITIYWARLGASPWIIQQLIRHKSALACAGFTRLPVPGCEAGPIMLCYKVPQDEIHKLASEISLQKPYSWIPTDENIGRYIVSGMTEPAQLGLITSLPEDLFSKIGGLAEVSFNTFCTRVTNIDAQDSSFLPAIGREILRRTRS